MLKNIGSTQSFFIPAMGGHIFDVENFAPLFKASCFAFNGDEDEASFVSVLNGPYRPSTISGFVPSFVVDPVDGVLLAGSFSYVGQESLKAVSPHIANVDSTPAVIMERCVGRVGAALDDVFPNDVLRSVAHSVSSAQCPNGFPLGASARLNVSKIELRPIDDDDVPAITSSVPSRSPIDGSSKRKNGKSVFFSADKIQFSCHSNNLEPTSGTVKWGGERLC